MGRPKSFERDTVLDKAMTVFWERGYEATSIQNLVDATGINRASMYDCFGDKHGLFRAAMERYLETVSARRASKLDGSGPVRTRLKAYFDDLVSFSEGPGRRLGCLLTNSLVEMAPRDREVGSRLSDIMGRLEHRFEALIREGQASGEIDAGKDPAAVARFLVATVQGVRVVSRGGIYDGGALHDIVTTALQTLDA